LFLYYFFFFHIYFFAYPFGFSYLALFTMNIFSFHAMMHFWNLYEVPAFDSGMISPAYPRIGRRIPPTPERPNRRERMNEDSSAVVTNPVAPPEDSSNNVRQVGRANSLPSSPARFAQPSSASFTSPSAQNLLPPFTTATRVHRARTRSSSDSFSSSSACEVPLEAALSHPNSASRPRAASQRNTSKFVIQLPNVDVNKSSNTAALAISSNPPVPKKRSRTLTDADLAEVAGLSAALEPLPSSLAIPFSSHPNNNNNTGPGEKVPQDTSSSHFPVPSLPIGGGGGGGGNRPRSESNMSTGSNGSAGSIQNILKTMAVLEPPEVRKMRLEQEKLRFQVNDTPSYYQQKHNHHLHHPGSSSSGIGSGYNSHHGSPVTGTPNAKESLSPAREPISSPLLKESSSSMRSPPSIQFPSFAGKESEEENKNKSSSQRTTTTTIKGGGRDRALVEQDELVDFFLDDLSPVTPPKSSRPPIHSIAMEEDEQTNNGKPVERKPEMKNTSNSHNNNINNTNNNNNNNSINMQKNYSFNVFGDVIEED
jgi:hypothetical protein